MGERSGARRPSAGPVAVAMLATLVAAPGATRAEQPTDRFFAEFPPPVAPAVRAPTGAVPAARGTAAAAVHAPDMPSGLLMPLEQQDSPPPDPPATGDAAAQAPEPAPPPLAAPPPPPAAPPPVPPRPGGTGSTRLVANFEEQIDVPAGQSVIVRLLRPAERVAIADPEIADVVLVSPKEILINGRGRRHTAQTGETVIQEAQTSLVVWDKEGRADVRGLYVNRSRNEQIELSVTVAELNRTAIENEGFDFHIFDGKVFVNSNVAKLTQLDQLHLNFISPMPPGAATFQDNSTENNDRVTFSVFDFNNNFAAFVELLQREGLAKVLARPTLMARSGEPAHFRSGGEVPIPLVTNNQVAVQFKEFGAIVDFTPTLREDTGIDLKVTAELSQPDSTLSSVTVGGFVVPAFRSRQTSTRVRLRDGQSLLIAGLLRDDETEDEQKVPYLGDVPGLGVFFRHTSFNHTRSELVILVRPSVQAPERDDASSPLPTDRGPMTFEEQRTKPEPQVMTRPRFPLHRHGNDPGDKPAP